MASTTTLGVDVLDETLRPYQREGVSFLFRNEAALLADEMGLGKTVQTIIAIRLMVERSSSTRCLIVAPTSLSLNWERECDRWAPELVVRRVVGDQADRERYYGLPIQVLIATYEQIRLDGFDRIHEAFDVVVLDEAQRIKNYPSRTALACRLLPRNVSWALTGTPVENSRADLLSVFAFLRPGLLHRTDSREQILVSIEPHFLRRRKRDVLPELPPILPQDINLEMGDLQRRAYDAAWGAGVGELSSGPRPVAATSLFALITKLKQLCNVDPESGESCKLDALDLLLESAAASQQKVIVFSQYVTTLHWLAERIQSVPTSIYSGEQSSAERDAVLSTFETAAGPHVLLMSLRAGGVGINVPSADLVVLFDRWWNPAMEAQAVKRAHRFGRLAPLHVIRLLVEDSVEDRIDEILRSKVQVFEDYVESAASADVSVLTRGELLRALSMSHADADARPANSQQEMS
jgi:SNF2 family DNA or RNA helicase